ncbi:MAG TPA: hypothetical protein VGK20_19470 [Candidatus Binatia bacterium]|jgi:hypothetical protein
MKAMLRVSPLALAGVLAMAGPAAAAGAVPASYSKALQTADAFLHAWLVRDAAAGRGLMASSLLDPPGGVDAAAYSSWLSLYMTGESSPRHQAYELHPGQCADESSCSFPVTLFEYASGDASAFGQPGQIELVHEREGWRVTRLPRSSDNR